MLVHLWMPRGTKAHLWPLALWSALAIWVLVSRAFADEVRWTIASLGAVLATALPLWIDRTTLRIRAGQLEVKGAGLGAATVTFHLPDIRHISVSPQHALIIELHSGEQIEFGPWYRLGPRIGSMALREFVAHAMIQVEAARGRLT